MKVSVTKERFQGLIKNLTPGSFLVVASEGEVIIKGQYVDYVYSTKNL